MGGVEARDKIEAENINFNVSKTRFILLKIEETMECEANVLGACLSRRPIYVSSSHKLCILGLFKGDVEEMKGNCQVEAMTGEMLP